jgi:hypothetical protein
MILFVLGFAFTLLALFHSREIGFKKHGILEILLYSIFYLMVYPVLLIISIYEFIRGKETW